jgi:crotonobetainyl-CoA:carnitine CoA-transferase CaiB-like acyl-CoA transferase
MYRACDGWVFLAAPLPEEWTALANALQPHVDLRDDPRFATADGRTDNDTALTDVPAEVFARRDAAAWEDALTAPDVGCVEVAELPSERVLQSDVFFYNGHAVDAVSPIIDHHRRLAPIYRCLAIDHQSRRGMHRRAAHTSGAA